MARGRSSGQGGRPRRGTHVKEETRMREEPPTYVGENTPDRGNHQRKESNECENKSGMQRRFLLTTQIASPLMHPILQKEGAGGKRPNSGVKTGRKWAGTAGCSFRRGTSNHHRRT